MSQEQWAGSPYASYHACRSARTVLISASFVAFCLQVIIGPEAQNITCSAIAATMGALTAWLVLRTNLLKFSPLPVLVVLGFQVCTMTGALVLETVAWKPLVFNLQVPILTFSLCGVFQLSLLGALYTFRHSRLLRGAASALSERIVRPLWAFRPPSTSELWAMGLLGATVYFTVTVALSGEQRRYGDLSKVAVGLSFLMYAPFLIPMLPGFFPERKLRASTRKTWLLVPYLVVVIGLGVFANSRGTFAWAIASLGLALLMAWLLGQLEFTALAKRRLLIAFAFTLLCGSTFADLATAMVVAREDRANNGAFALVNRTLEVMQDHALLESVRAASATLTGQGVYEEHYLSNPFLARLIHTKFVDNTLSLEVVRNGNRSPELFAMSVDKIMGLLPTPLLNALGADLDKGELEYSVGDFLYSAQFGAGLGGYKTGSTVGHAYALFGPAFVLAVFALFLVVFAVLQGFTAHTAGFVIISPVILLTLVRLYFIAASDGITDPVALILRQIPQELLIYWIVFFVARHLRRPINLRSQYTRP